MQKRDVLYRIKQWITRILLIACECEIVFFYSLENLYGCIALLYGWLLISKLCVKREYMMKYPLPTLAMFGLGLYYNVFPIVITLLESKPLTFNFQVPYLTFTNQIISITVITLSFCLAVKSYRPRNLLNLFWNKIGYMTVPSEKGIWLMGILGLVALLTIMAGQGEELEYQETGNSIAIVIQFCSTLAIAPICLYFKNLYGDNTPAKSRHFVKYYIALLMLIGIATTRRMMIFNSVVTIALIYIFLLIYNNTNIFTTRNVFIVCIVGYLVVGPLADLAAAMILNRQLVYSTTAGDTFNQVWDLYQDKETLHKAYQLAIAVKDNDGNNEEGWSEYYVDNIFLDRFCNLRTIDATLYNAQKCGFGNSKGEDYYKNFWINELPSPITNGLGLKKDFLGTATDHMVVDNFGDRYSLFGCKVGGETGIGLWMFGYWYYAVALVTYFVMFYFLCSFVNINGGYLLMPIPILISFLRYWMLFLNANGIFSSMGYVFTRSNLNKIFLYCLLIFVFRKLSLTKKI